VDEEEVEREFFKYTIKDPEFAHELCDMTAKYHYKLAKEAIDTGAEIIMCGDEYADVVGASRAGLIPVLYLRKVDFPYEKEINIPDLIKIKNLNEIIQIVENYNQ